MNEETNIERSLQQTFNLPSADDTDSNYFSQFINEDLNS